MQTLLLAQRGEFEMHPRELTFREQILLCYLAQAGFFNSNQIFYLDVKENFSSQLYAC